MAPDHRSIHPGLPGLPWWGAMVVAATATVVGVAFDAGTRELSHVFAALYVLGCVAAVLMVRQSGVFTAVIQPPLILFCAVPGAYWLFHGGTFTGIKEILINCGYPLIERFPLMLFTSAGVLLIGMLRWYLGTTARAATPTAETPAAARPGWLASIFEGLAGKLTAVVKHDRAPAARSTPPRRGAGDRRRRSTASRQYPPRRPSTGNRSVPPRSRHLRPPVDDRGDPGNGRPRRRRPSDVRADPPPPPRRPRSSYQPPAPPARRRQAGIGDAENMTHHPISRVRYRGADPRDS